MILVIPDLLNAASCATIAQVAATAQFTDGKKTAGPQARIVKTNLQMDESDKRLGDLRKQIGRAVISHQTFQRAVMPKAVTGVLINRYDVGMSYGTHVDESLMGGVRTDISFTVFLSDPKSYDGGELEFDMSGTRRIVKLPIGAGVIYPAGTLHRVQPVTRGSRLAVVGWSQSFIRDDAKRELVYELETASRQLFEQHGKSPAFDAVAKSLVNLKRMWVEP